VGDLLIGLFPAPLGFLSRDAHRDEPNRQTGAFAHKDVRVHLIALLRF
jgi:hypothetical protein